MIRRNTFSFRGEKVECDGPVRIGSCEVCKRRLGLKKTFLHHFWYDPLDKLRFTIEVCFKCHLSIKQGNIIYVPNSSNSQVYTLITPLHSLPYLSMIYSYTSPIKIILTVAITAPIVIPHILQCHGVQTYPQQLKLAMRVSL